MFEFLRFLKRSDAGAPGPLEKERRARQLDGKRRHMRGQLAHNQREIRQLWTAYRGTGDRDEKKALKRKINAAEAKRKDLVKQMVKLQRDMERLGFKTQAGHVDLS